MHKESDRYMMVREIRETEKEVQMWADGLAVVANDTSLGTLRYFAIKGSDGKYECYCFYDHHVMKDSDSDKKRGFRVLSYHNLFKR